jgi:IclR family acetate operon transcriptional repressor
MAERVEHRDGKLEPMAADITVDALRATKSPRTVQSVERALELLKILGESDREMSLSEIASKASLRAPTCHHLLATLAKHGFVGRSPRTRSYFLGSKITELSNQRLKQFSLVDIAMPHLRELNETTLESVHLATLQGHALVTLAKLESKFPIRAGSDEANRTDAAHATATGKAILAWLPEAEIARVIAHMRLHRFTDKTISTISDLIEDLRLVRRNGYSVDDEEFQPGVVCIGAAIRDHTGAVIGSVSCSMPKMRAEGEHLEKVKAAVRACAGMISERYGNRTESTR